MSSLMAALRTSISFFFSPSHTTAPHIPFSQKEARAGLAGRLGEVEEVAGVVNSISRPRRLSSRLKSGREFFGSERARQSWVELGEGSRNITLATCTCEIMDPPSGKPADLAPGMGLSKALTFRWGEVLWNSRSFRLSSPSGKRNQPPCTSSEAPSEKQFSFHSFSCSVPRSHLS